ncbi:MAG: zf-HC2 domain-containing protein [Candidatus Zixiibacteriota bacterium]
MSCKKYEKWVNLFWDRRLSQSQEEELKKHLLECKTCQEKLSFLESVEGKAKEIRAKEPSKEYWDTFSSRVREKITASKEKSTVFGWKKALVNVFSPWKIRIATAVVSILLVFIIGKLYVDYRGKTIVPKTPVSSAVKEAPLGITESEKEEISLPAESKDKTSTPSEQPKKALPVVSSDQEKGKVTSPVVEGRKKETGLKEQKISLTDRAAEKKSISLPAPVAEEKGVTPIVKPQAEGTPPSAIAEQPVPAEAAPAAGAGKGMDTVKTREVRILSREEKAIESAEIYPKGPEEKPMKAISKLPSVDKAPSFYSLTIHDKGFDEAMVPQIKETDTLIQAGELREIIQIWQDHFKDNPVDSINDQGYLQVATAYFLLNRLSFDSTVINQGSYLIEEYMNRAKDPAIKDQLSDKLEKIKALGKK